MIFLQRTLAQEVHAVARDLERVVPLHLDIRRDHVLIDAMREAKNNKFTPTKMIQVLEMQSIICNLVYM